MSQLLALITIIKFLVSCRWKLKAHKGTYFSLGVKDGHLLMSSAGGWVRGAGGGGARGENLL